MGFNWGGAGSGAVSGATAGSAFGPWGTAIGGAAGGLMGGLSGGGKSSGMTQEGLDRAMQPLNQIPGTMKPYYDPYINAGTSAIPGYQDMMKQLMQNPNEFLSKMGQSYQASPGYQWNVGQQEKAISNANAAGGLAGSPQHERQNAEMVQGLAGKDYNDYMNRIMQAFGFGAAGTEGLIKQGGAMSSDLATNLANALIQKSNLQYAGEANINQGGGGMFG